MVRHAESTENADKSLFYGDPRPWSGESAHVLSRDLVGLTPRGFRQSCWLAEVLPEIVGDRPRVYTSQYRRAKDCCEIVYPGRAGVIVTGLLNEMHYGQATYMGKRELFTRWPDSEHDRQHHKHLWTPPGDGGESLAGDVTARCREFLADVDRGLVAVVAFTHHTTILALRALLEDRPLAEVVEESRRRKTPNAGVLVYELDGDERGFLGLRKPPIL